jgi:hypothetical protein
MEVLCRNGNFESWPSTQKKRVGALVCAALLLMAKSEANSFKRLTIQRRRLVSIKVYKKMMQEEMTIVG